MKLRIMGWAAECEEWSAIRDELIALKRGPVTAYEVSKEQKARMFSRGERPMTLAEIMQGVLPEPNEEDIPAVTLEGERS